MPTEKIYDLIGIGIGPFNLGLAALTDSIKELDCLFIDQNESFNWHPGIMIKGTRLQVPFYADLVTLADPCSKFSYMNFLKAKQRMFRFAIAENYFIERRHYNEYCRWVCEQLPSLNFNTPCTSIEKENKFYRVRTGDKSFLAQKLVLGTGTVPFIPDIGTTDPNKIIHSSAYLYHKQNLLGQHSLAIIGNGQSAAEIFYDLLDNYTGKLSWYTRSSRFNPMDYSKLTLEMSTPDYIDHFFSLPDRMRPAVLIRQDNLYKGINQALINDIYEKLLYKEDNLVNLYTNSELIRIDTKSGSELSLHFRHLELERNFLQEASAVIMATGYKAVMPVFLKALRPYLRLDSEGYYKAKRNYSVDESDSIFIQNAEMNTHGFNASDLSLGPYRNAVIINTILGREAYSIEKNTTFQSFGLPGS